MPSTEPGTGERGFFDEHPRFLETSTTSAGLARLNLRHRALIETNRDILDGARVLDLASHDGRWSMAALAAGAAHVTGIEARPELVTNAEQTLATYGADPSSYRFVASDLFAALAREEHLDVDVVQCFGFLYHTLRFPEFFSRLRRLEPKYLLLDTRVANTKGNIIKILVNEATKQAHAAADDYTEGTKTLVGWPSPSALRLMLRTYGFRVEHEYDWVEAGRVAGGNLVGKYKRGERITWRCRWDPAAAPADADDDAYTDDDMDDGDL